MTTPYVTGTVSVTAGSAVVTGVGTGWLTSGLVAGQFGLDSANGNPIPVLSIDSDTQITLAKPWRGTTANAQAYWITYDTTPGQQTVANAQRLAEYIARLDKPFFSALSGLMPAVDKIPYFGAGGAGALADFNAAARALLAGGVLPDGQLPTRLRANALLVSDCNDFAANGWALAGPTTANSPPGSPYAILTKIGDSAGWQFANEVFSDRVWKRRFQTGVFQTWVRSGDAERGTNANGEYTRFADGTQICFARRTMTSNFQSRSWSSWTFPVAFAAGTTPNINHVINLNSLVDAGVGVNDATSLFVPSISDVSNTGGLLQMVAGRTLTNWNVVNTYAQAIGRWF